MILKTTHSKSKYFLFRFGVTFKKNVNRVSLVDLFV